MLLPIYEENQSSASKKEGSNEEEASWKQSLGQHKSVFLTLIHTVKWKNCFKWKSRVASVCHSIQWKFRKSLEVSLTSKAEVIRNAKGGLEVLATAQPPGRNSTSFQPLQDQEMG